MNSKVQNLSTVIIIFPHDSLRQVAQIAEAEKFFCIISADGIFNSIAKPRKLRDVQIQDFTQWREAARKWQNIKHFRIIMHTTKK